MARRRKSAPRQLSERFLTWLDTAALMAWGVLLLRFWITGRINILLHPDYVWLAVLAGICLVGIAGAKALQLLNHKRRAMQQASSMQHFSLLPKGWSSGLMLVVALFGLQYSPQAFASQVALERGVAETLTMTRSQPQSFRGGTRPEDRSLIDWVRTLNVYPEPDAYTGQAANIEGFVIHSTELPDQYLMLARFVITCCAADVYPVALPVKLSASRTEYPPDRWFRVEGRMITETLNEERQLVIEATNLVPIEEPENPYDY
ncbi:TIGR03943 family putative permease subunit [Leptolyngbya sp. AN02str]|uniref:TIGR03943 family putative permease subunit n=1 Tax=Leptolyngbya sp. AN02str TaxID=3423363 RepID=UPI003D31EF07